jgi:hypothetical protein
MSGAAQLGLFDGSADALVRKPPASEGIRPQSVQRPIRQLTRDDLKPLYLNTQGFRVGKSGEVLQVKDKDKTVQEVRIGEVCQVNLLGNRNSRSRRHAPVTWTPASISTGTAERAERRRFTPTPQSTL